MTPAASGGGTKAPVATPPIVAGTAPTVCNGALGTGADVTTVEWSIYAASKYKVQLGSGLDASELTNEPIMLSVHAAQPNLNGTVSLDPATLGEATLSPESFASSALPETRTDLSQLGFSQTDQLIYDLTTSRYSFDETKAYVPYASAGFVSRYWYLRQATVDPNPTLGPAPFYVTQFESSVGVSWVFAVHFDDECKSKQLPAGELPWKSTQRTTDEMQAFLVTNKAKFVLRVVQTGPKDAELESALQSTTCSPGDLAACDALMTKIEQVRTRFMAAPISDASYEKLITDGNDGPWIIGSIRATPADRFQ